MFPSTDTYACFPLPSRGYRGRSLRKPCGSPLSSVLWGCKTAQPSFRVPSGRPLGFTFLSTLARGVPLWCGRRWGALVSSWAIPLKTCPGLGTPATPARPRNNGRCQVLPSATLTASASQRGQISELILVACFLAVYASHPPVAQ